MYFDGSYTLKGAEADIVLILPKSDILKYAIQTKFSAIITLQNIRYWSRVFGWPKISAFDDSLSGDTHSW
jgi:hypothetical protein